MSKATRTVAQSPAPQIADSHDLIRVQGARVNNLKDISQAVMARADWIIDLGPGAGHDGRRIIFEGTPADLVAAGSTLTGEHLAACVGIKSRKGERNYG
jgi:excinuclease UvrABC ATPase subunit